MAGRTNFQACSFQCIRPGELWQCNWLEGRNPYPEVYPSSQRLMRAISAETGTVVSLVYDIHKKRITTLLAFSKGNLY